MKKPFRTAALLLALVLYAIAFASQLVLRRFLSVHGLLSADEVLIVSFVAQTLVMFVTGFAVTFVARSSGWRELGAASLLMVGVAFAALKKIEPPSFSPDHYLARTDELVVWALLVGLAGFLLALWGGSFALIIGASESVELKSGYEAGIARTHLRLDRSMLLRLAWIGLSIPGTFFGVGIVFDRFSNGHQVPLWSLPASALSFLAFLALLGDWIRSRVREARLKPGQKRKRPATQVMTFISIAGVAVGVWALTVVLAVMSGFELDLKKKILGTTAHAMLQRFTGDMTEWRTIAPKIRAVPGVVGASPFVFGEVMISHRDALTGSEIKGIEPSTVGQVSELPKQVIAGEVAWIDDPSQIPRLPAKPHAALSSDLQDQDPDQYLEDTYERRKRHPEEDTASKIDDDALFKIPGICIGKEMSHALRVWVGDVVSVITPLGDMGPTGPVPRGKNFRVACILYSGMYEYDMKFAYIGIPEAQSFFRTKDAITGFELKYDDVDAARGLGHRVLDALGNFPYRMRDWTDLNRNLFSALKLEKVAMGIILTFIVLVACFNILSTLIMLVLEKTKEISILKSMGARDASVMKIFVFEGMTIGFIGTAMGILMGLASCSFVERFGLKLDADVYYISSLPVIVEPGQFAVVALISLCLAYLATLYPAIKAAQLSPVDGLRED
ncbi:MAG: FtsX-like permease family protein [Deltaproteobacteria bacterium]|nr:FtsX-like permease family protein [Deltaproteobacteria bacterium]